MTALRICEHPEGTLVNALSQGTASFSWAEQQLSTAAPHTTSVIVAWELVQASDL